MKMTYASAASYERRILKQAAEIISAKRCDYSGEEDPYANFRMSAFVGVEPWRGVMVRMLDKLSRLKNITEAGEAKVKDEAVEDTICDLVNYALILGGLLEENNE